MYMDMGVSKHECMASPDFLTCLVLKGRILISISAREIMYELFVSSACKIKLKEKEKNKVVR